MKARIKKALQLLRKEDYEQDKCPYCGSDDYKGKRRIHDGCLFGQAIELIDEVVKELN